MFSSELACMKNEAGCRVLVFMSISKVGNQCLNKFLMFQYLNMLACKFSFCLNPYLWLSQIETLKTVLDINFIFLLPPIEGRPQFKPILPALVRPCLLP